MLKPNLAPLVLIILCLYLFYGCQGESNPDDMAENSAMVDDSGEFVKVNDVVITNNDYEQFAKMKRVSQSDTNLSEEDIIDEMIIIEVLRQEAIKQGIADRAEIIAQFKHQENSILINALISGKFSDLTFTDDELKTEYTLLAGPDTNEFKARHILLQSEDDANAVIEELEVGGNYIELAKQKSLAPSAASGGDLGWFKAETMVPPFAQAVQSMQKGSYTQNPVQTRFGWHVILLEDKRMLDRPAFEDIKQDVQRALTQHTIEKYIDRLEDDATIVRPDSIGNAKS